MKWAKILYASKNCWSSATAQSGVALAVMLWLLAALSLMAAGIVLMARVDVQLAQIQVRTSQAAALGDGAVRLLMRTRVQLQNERQVSPRGIFRAKYLLAERQVNVRAVPLTGLFDINQLSRPLWQELLQYGAGLDETAASALAENMIAWQNLPVVDANAAPQRYGRFEVIEDLLLVRGMTRELLERIRPMIHAYQGTAGIDLASAPTAVLHVLARGDDALVERFEEERASSPNGSWDGYPGLSPEYLLATSSSWYRVDARVLQLDGSVLQRSRWVQADTSDRDKLPWRLLRAEPVVAVPTLAFTTFEEAHGSD